MELKTINLLKVAVTGHRFIDHKSTLIKSVHQLLTELSSTYANSDIHLFSALAEGSDQLIANVAKEYQQIKLVVPLPLPIAEYIKDFQSKQSIQSFHGFLKAAYKILYLPAQNDRQTSYHNLGEYLVKECDYLITIWNGEYTQKIGGTGEVVKFAIEMKVPVYWIYSNQIDGEAINSLKYKKQIGELELIRK